MIVAGFREVPATNFEIHSRLILQTLYKLVMSSLVWQWDHVGYPILS